MKKKLILSKVFLVVCTVLLTCSVKASEVTENDDRFIGQVKKITQIDMIPKKFTQDLAGYEIPLFSEKNRNHFDDRPEGCLTPIKALVMHYTVCDFPSTLGIFTKDISENRVSATYVITEAEKELEIPGGKVVQVVPEEKRPWHAGISKWRELVNLNGVSIGIENVNKGFTDSSNGYRIWYPFDADQIRSLGTLSRAIVRKYHISPTYVVGHADVALGRKQDPGILFPWEQLYDDYGVGAWVTKEELQNPSVIPDFCPDEPLPQNVSLAFLSTYLNKYGYNIEPTAYPSKQLSDGLKAFKAHFSQNQNPRGYDETVDMNDMRWIWALTGKYR